MKNLLTIIPKLTDGTSFYRGAGPLSQLKSLAAQEKNDFTISIHNEVDWAILAFQDGVFAQRPYNTQHLRALELCKANGKNVWVDYDDNLLVVPKDNPTFSVYEKAVKNVATILALADQVTVSTAELASSFDEIRSRAGLSPCTWVPNAFNDHLIQDHPERAMERNPLVIWRGSPTHDRDLLTYAHELQHVTKEFKQWTFTFIGNPFWVVMEMLNTPNVMEVKPVDTIEYFDVIGKIRPSVMIVPLHDNRFNRCKSNIAAIEAFYAGAVPIVPDWDEWRIPGTLRYTTREEFRNILSGALLGTYDLKKLAQEGWEWVKESRAVSKVNRLRYDILKSTLGI